MTSKIQQIAMFAIAAFALGGMMVVPAFANGNMSEDITMVFGNNPIAYDSFGCGSNDDCTMRSAALAGVGSDQWTVWFGPTGNTECDVEIVISGSSWNESRTFYNLDFETSTTISGPSDIEVNDDFTVSIDYSNCS